MNILKVLVLFAASIPTLASASIQVLGFEVGVSTLSQVKAQLAKHSGKINVSTSSLTGGPQLKTIGARRGIDGHTKVCYIFDVNQKLAMVMVDMPKTNFNRTYDSLSAKYKQAPKESFGALFAKFEGVDETIELDGTQQGFEMQARYFRNDVFQRLGLQTSSVSLGQTR